MFAAFPRFGELISPDRNGLGFTLNINTDSTFIRSAVRNPIVFHYVPMGATPFVWFVTEGDSDLSICFYLIESDNVVGVSMPDGDAILAVVKNPVILRDPMFHAQQKKSPSRFPAR